MSAYRIFVEKKPAFQVEAQSLCNELNMNLLISLKKLRLINVYDIFNCSENLLQRAKESVFSEKVSDVIYDQMDLTGKTYFAVEFVPGQFDQRADSAMQCMSLIAPEEKPIVRSAKLLIFEDKLIE